jgi:hypothetical protein
LGLKVTGKKKELADRISAHRAENAAASATQNKQPAQTHLERISKNSSHEETPQARRQDQEQEPQAKGQHRVALEEWAREESEEGSESEAEGAVGHALGGAGVGGSVIKYLSTRGHPKARWRGRFRYSVHLLTSAKVLDLLVQTCEY